MNSALTTRIRDVLDANYHHLHPFNQRMHAGSLSRREIQQWVANRFAYQNCIPVKDSLILAKLPREHRRRWIRRIVDHDGHGGSEGGIEAWITLGLAVGLSREEVVDERYVSASARFAVGAYVNFCAQRPWLEAVASSLTELMAPGLIDRRLSVLDEHYPWIDGDGLAYFRSRLVQAPRDADHAMELVQRYATDEPAKDAVVAAVAFKCDVLWSLLDAVEKASTPEMAHVR